MKNPRVDINTVDSFQGQERDVIIYSPVRYRTNVFVSDHQRLNVSFTRARYALFVCVQDQMFSVSASFNDGCNVINILRFKQFEGVGPAHLSEKVS